MHILELCDRRTVVSFSQTCCRFRDISTKILAQKKDFVYVKYPYNDLGQCYTGQLIRAFEEADPSQPLADHTKLWDLTLEAGVCKISRPKDNMEFQIYLPRSGAEILNESINPRSASVQWNERKLRLRELRILLKAQKVASRPPTHDVSIASAFKLIIRGLGLDRLEGYPTKISMMLEEEDGRTLLLSHWAPHLNFQEYLPSMSATVLDFFEPTDIAKPVSIQLSSLPYNCKLRSSPEQQWGAPMECNSQLAGISSEEIPPGDLEELKRHLQYWKIADKRDPDFPWRDKLLHISVSLDMMDHSYLSYLHLEGVRVYTMDDKAMRIMEKLVDKVSVLILRKCSLDFERWRDAFIMTVQSGKTLKECVLEDLRGIDSKKKKKKKGKKERRISYDRVVEPGLLKKWEMALQGNLMWDGCYDS